MRTTTLLLLFFHSIIPLAQAQDYIELTWSDEFDVNGPPSAANWNYDLGAGGWGNNEVQTYTNSSNNSRVENGFLIIEAKKDGSGNWTSARLNSASKKTFTYGKIVFRAKLATGVGTWPALWMLGQRFGDLGWPACGEIDIMEHVGWRPGVIQSSLHTNSSFGNTTNTGFRNGVNDYATAFHTYEALWTPDKLQFSVDGVPYYTYQPSPKNANNWPFKDPFFLIMNIAMGGNFGQAVDPNLSFARMEVDYVRVYQPFTALKVDGPTIVQENQSGVKFTTNQIQNATYEWTLPAGAEITSGEGTSSITVNWGESEGDVSVAVNFNAQTLEKSISVVHVYKPELPVFSLKSDYNMTWQVSDATNTYEISQEDELLKVAYTINQVVSVPALVAIPNRPLNLTDHPVLRVRAKSYNKSRSLLMRMDWADQNGVATTKSPVFNFTPLIDDGEYYDYRFNFESTNQWKSNTVDVDKTRIKQLNFYIDFGTFGTRDADSLWIENIWIENPGQESLIPNRPSHLSGSNGNDETLTLTWKDNSTTETGFQIFSAPGRNGSYTLLSTVDANIKTHSVSNTPDVFYRVRSINAQGESTFSNAFTAEDIVTAVSDEELKAIQLYPNPAYKTVMLNLSSLPARQLTLISAHGLITKNITLSATGLQTIDVSSLPSGVYFAQITLANNIRVIRKLLIQNHE